MTAVAAGTGRRDRLVSATVLDGRSPRSVSGLSRHHRLRHRPARPHPSARSTTGFTSRNSAFGTPLLADNGRWAAATRAARRSKRRWHDQVVGAYITHIESGRRALEGLDP